MSLRANMKPACADPAYDPEAWFPDPPERRSSITRDEARRQILNAVEAIEVCSRCPIQKECLDFSFTSIDTINYGIYGGTLAYERRQAVDSNPRTTMGFIYQARIRKLAASRGVFIPTIGKRERGATWLSDQPELNAEFITRGMKLAGDTHQQ